MSSPIYSISKIVALVAIIIVFTFQGWSQPTWTSNTTGLWASASTWTTSGGASGVPPSTLSSDQSVIITNGHTVTQTDDLVLEGTASLTIENGGKLMMGDADDPAPTFNMKSSGNTFTIANGIYECYASGNGGNLTVEAGTVDWSGGSVYCSGNMLFKTNASVTMMNMCIVVWQNLDFEGIGESSNYSILNNVYLILGTSGTGNFSLKASSYVNVTDLVIVVGSDSGTAKFESSTMNGSIYSLYGNDEIKVSGMSGTTSLDYYCADSYTGLTSYFTTGLRIIDCDLTSSQECDAGILYAISGTVYNDPDGGTISGTGIGIAGSTQLYISLLNGTTILSTETVNNDGTYAFTSLGPGNYSLVLHTNPAGSTTASLPPGWINTAEGIIPAGDGTANGTISTFTIPPNVTTADFGIQQQSPADQSDLSIHKSDSPDPVTAGGNLTYTLVVTNNGPSTAQNVTVTDPLPAEVTESGSAATLGSYTDPTWTIGAMAAGQTETLTITVTVNINTCEAFSNSATVTSTTTDPNLANNSATVTTSVLDVTPPELTCPPISPFECIDDVPDPLDYDDFILAGGSAEDNCGIDTSTFTWVEDDWDGNACPGIITRTYSILDTSGNPATCTQTILIDDTTPPVFADCPDEVIFLACNQQPDEEMAIEDAGAVTDVCDITLTVTATAGAIAENGCERSQTWAVTATDNCTNVATCSVTYTWTEDTEVPEIETIAVSGDLGCNPTVETPAFSFTDNCGFGVTDVSTTGVASDGCLYAQSWTASATDACGNVATPVTIEYTWTVDTQPPVFALCPSAPIDLGCNPTALPSEALAIAAAGTVTDDCDLTLTVTAAGGAVTGTCVKTQVWTVTAATDCGPDATCEVTYTWTVDTQPPVFALCPSAPIDLGCNPTALPSEALAIAAAGTVTDDCDLTLTVTAAGGAVTGTCVKTQVWTVTAATDCGPDATCEVTYTWKIDVTPPTFIGLPAATYLGCNLATEPGCGTATVTAFDACDGAVSVTCTEGTATQTSDCDWERAVLYEAEDACGNPVSITLTYTWTVDDEPGVISTTAISGPIPGNCCNPDVITPTFTGLDNCEGVFTPTISTDGPINVSGCDWEQTWVASYTDVCGNAALPVTITYTWKQDLEPPELFWNIPPIYGLPWPAGPIELGCNPLPAKLPSCNGFVTASDNCVGSTAVTCLPGEITGGCQKSQSFTYTAEDLCCNVAIRTVTYTWKEDLVPPEFTGVPADSVLGCNPMELYDCEDFEFDGVFPVIAFDLCDGNVSNCIVECLSDGATTTNGCDWTQTFFFTANDACGNVGTESVTFTWRIDHTPPVLGPLPEGGFIGYCPDELPECESFFDVFADDICGTATVTCEANPVTAADDCGMIGTLTFTFSAYDECGNTATPVDVVYTWIEDYTPPNIVIAWHPDLGCIPSMDDRPDCGTATVTAWDNCDLTVTLTCEEGAITETTDCQFERSITYYATDDCFNVASLTITYTWREDGTPPVLIGVPDDEYLGCNPPEPTCGTFTVTTSDNCDLVVTVTCTESEPVPITPNCRWMKTLTWYAEDDCGNGVTETATFTWKEDLVKPIISGVPTSDINLGCNPVQRGVPMPACDPLVSAWDNCDGAMTPQCEVLAPEYDGCNVTHKVVYTATDVCCNVGVATATYVWKEDLEAPVIGGVPDDEDLGCNPAEIPDCNDFTITATDNCDDDLEDCCLKCIPGVPTITTGCDWTVTHLFRAWDLCGNIGTESVTFTWRIDTDPPVITGIPATQPVDLGWCPERPTCDPTVEATDVCGEVVTFTCQAGAVVSTTSCGWTQVFTYTAIDECENVAVESITYIWKEDDIEPVLDLPYTFKDLGCNPNALPGCVTVTATDNCDPVVSLTCTPGDITGECNKQQIFTYTALDECGNLASGTITYIWKDDEVPPVITNLPVPPTELICDLDPSCEDFEVTATDDCDGQVTVVCSAGDITGTCVVSQPFYFYAEDECGNGVTEVVTFTWRDDHIAPVISGVPTSDIILGCNPTDYLPITCANHPFIGWVTAVDDCDGIVGVSCQVGTATETGDCEWMQTITFTATDCCLNIASETATYRWKVDNEPPQFIGLPVGRDLGCNPVENGTPIPVCGDFYVTAEDNCGDCACIVSCEEGDVVSDGCDRSKTFTFTVEDACLNQNIAYVTYTWKVDLLAPVLSGVPVGGDLGLCPPDVPDCEDFDVTATDVCDGVWSATCTSELIEPSEGYYNYTKIFTFTAVDACGNGVTETVTYTWLGSGQPPDIYEVPQDAYLGCNPEELPSCEESFGGVYAEDAQGEPVSVTCEAGEITGDNCLKSQTFTFEASDDCYNVGTESVTYTWKEDLVAPEWDDEPVDRFLGCNVATPTCDDFVFTATDNCDGVITATCQAGIPSGECDWSQEFTYTAADECGNEISKTVTYTWKIDYVAPVLSNLPAGGNLGCNPPSLPECDDFNVIASDNCDGSDIVYCEQIGPTGDCIRTLAFVFTATDLCGNEVSATVTYTYKFDLTPPALFNVPEGGELGCDPQELPTCAPLNIPDGVYAVDGCDGAICEVECTPGLILGDGCAKSQTFTYAAVDACGNWAIEEVTYTWMEDPGIPPVIYTVAVSGDLGCNLVIEAPVFTGIDGCGGAFTPTVGTSGPANEGCTWAQTWTASFTDVCGNVAIPVNITYTWTIDTELPVISTLAESGDLGCNPQIAPPAFTGADNCDGVFTPEVTTAGPAIVTGCDYTQTWAANYTDACSNDALEVTITYTWTQDTEDPTITCPADVEVYADDGEVFATGVDLGTPVTGDNCGVATVTNNALESYPVGETTVTWTVIDNCGNEATCEQTVTVLPQALRQLEVAVYLQGPYAGAGMMNTDINDRVPLSQPYTGAPWNYAGTETVPSLGSAVVDWMLVELRTDATTMAYRKAGLLYNDGTLKVSFDGLVTDDTPYYVVLYARNHMPVMSQNMITIPAIGTELDMTQLANAYGDNSLILLENAGSRDGDIYGMIAGEVIADGQLRYSGATNDRGPILARILALGGTNINSVINGSEGAPYVNNYWYEDVNMNDQLKYNGAENDRAYILANITTLLGSPLLTGIYYSEVPGYYSSGLKSLMSNEGPVDIYLAGSQEGIRVVVTTGELIETGVVDNIQFTLAWNADDTDVEALLSEFASDYGLQPQGEPVTINGIAYQVYASATATYLPSMWNEGEEQTVLSFETEQGIQLADRLWIADNGFTSQNNGMYYISVWGTDVTGQITSVAVSINEPDQAMVIKTYPNPVSDGKLHIQVSGSSQERNLDIRIMDARGDLVMNQPWTVSGTVTRVIDLSTLPPGAYMLTISGDQVNYHKKVILLTLY